MLSKIFVKNIKIPEKVQVLFIKDNVLNFIGPSGGIVFNFHYFLKITVSEGFIFISGSSERLAILNTIVSLIKNIFYGIVNGYEKKLKLVGVEMYQNTNCPVYHFSQTSGTFHPDNRSYWEKNFKYFIDKWGFERIGSPQIWEANFEIPDEGRKFRPGYEGKYAH